MIGFVPFAVLTKPALKNNKITVGFSPDGFYVMSEKTAFFCKTSEFIRKTTAFSCKHALFYKIAIDIIAKTHIKIPIKTSIPTTTQPAVR